MISGRSVSDRSQARSSQVSGLPKVVTHCSTVACGSSSGGRCKLARKTGSLVLLLRQCPRSWGKLAVLRSRGRHPGIQVSSVTMMPLKPAASARCTRLAARSRSFGVYSWKKPGVAPNSAATSSIGSAVRVETTIGTPVAAAARAAVRSPRPSWAQMPMTPIGAMNTGDGKVRPNICTERSRSAAPTNMRGIRPQRSNASRLARCVRSSPAPPAT